MGYTKKKYNMGYPEPYLCRDPEEARIKQGISKEDILKGKYYFKDGRWVPNPFYK